MGSVFRLLSNRFLQVFLVAILAVAQFSNTLQHEYAWDDKIVILDNPDVKAGFSGLTEIWHKQHSDFLHDQIGYRPLVLTSFAIEQEYFPLDSHVSHLMNVMYFSLLCIVMLLFLWQVVPLNWHGQALLITMLFLVHPLHVEVVANVKSRDEIFQLLFSLLSILFYWRWYKFSKWYMLVFSFVCFIAAILSRENAIVTVALIPLTVLIFEEGFLKTKLKRLLPVFGLVFIGVAIIGLSMIGDAGQAETEGLGIVYEDPALGNGLLYARVDGMNRVLNFNLVMLRYLKNFVWPVDLVYYYGYDYLEVYETNEWPAVLGAVLTIFLMVLVLVGLRQNRVFSFGALFFFIGIFPFLQQFNFMPDAMADRFAFGPSFGLSVALVSGSFWVFSRFLSKERVRLALIGFLTPVFIFYSATTFSRNKAWKNNYTLFSTDIGKLENCAKCHEHYADVLLEKYNKTKDPKLIQDITYHYQTSIEISDKSYYSFLKLGSNYPSFGNPEMGIQVLKKAVELFPDRSDPNFYLGNALFQAERCSEAIPYLKKGIEYSPKVSDSYSILIKSYEQAQLLDEAVSLGTTAIRMFPTDILIRDAVCDVYMAKANYDIAFAHADTLLELAGTDARFWKKAIGIRQIAGRDDEAADLYRTALSLGVNFDN